MVFNKQVDPEIPAPVLTNGMSPIKSTTIAMVFTYFAAGSEQDTLAKLNPIRHSSYNPNRACIPGTRAKIIHLVVQWALRSDNNGLLWAYGLVGIGKSSILTSVCQQLDKKTVLVASFFCRRDDPHLRDPRCVLNTIIHRLATRLKPYAVAVAKAIQDDPQLCTSHVRRLYRRLVEEPLKSLEAVTAPGVFIVVIDGLDECEAGESRAALLACLRLMCQLVPWLKIIITSRPDEDINASFGQAADYLSLHNLDDYDASKDIYLFMKMRLSEIAVAKHRNEWSQEELKQLSKRARGRFIWAETACRFISGGLSGEERLQKLLVEPNSEVTSDLGALDLLYATIIIDSMENTNEADRWMVLQCIGAVIATSSHSPLPVLALEKLLSPEAQPGIFRSVLAALGSVLYEDGGPGGAVHIYHHSFADFITDQSRSKDLYVDMDRQNAALADGCLQTMLLELEFNICNLGTSHVFNRDVPDLDTRVRNVIGDHLRYSCIHWSIHLPKAHSKVTTGLLGKFLLGPELLYWIETLSLLGKLNVALSNLLTLTEWTTVSNLPRKARCY
jgi:hypothetical protein